MHVFLPICALLPILLPVSAWGNFGHRTVAYLASLSFDHQTAHFVDHLLKNTNGWDISDAALFADRVKHKRPETAVWHYIDAHDDPPRQCGVHFETDCNSSNKHPGCIVSAITAMTPLALNINPHDVNKTKEALMFLIHFIGDIHQPLHTENLSIGGTQYHVCFDRRCSNLSLHAVWDTEILLKHVGLSRHAGEDEEKAAALEWAQALHEKHSADFGVDGKECTNIQTPQDCALKWASESNSWNCKFVWNLPDSDLGGRYFIGAVPIVEDLVAKAGLRLGVWIKGLAKAAAEAGELKVQEL